MPDREEFMTGLQQLLQNKDVTTPLLAAAGTGLVGGTLSARSPMRRGESQAERRKRILRDAMLSAGAGGLGAAALRHGYSSLNNALPAGTENPAAKGLGILGRIGGGVGALSWAHYGAKKRWDTEAMTTFQNASNEIKALAPKGKDTTNARLKLKGLIDRYAGNPVALKAKFPNSNLPADLARSNIRIPGAPTTDAERWNALKSRVVGSYGKSKDVVNKVRAQPLKSTFNAARSKVAPNGAWNAAKGVPGKAEKQVINRLLPLIRRHPGISAGLATAVAGPALLRGVGNLMGATTPNFLNFQD